MPHLETPTTADDLKLLFEISQRMDKSEELQKAIGSVLDLVGHHLDKARIALSLFDHNSRQIVMYESYGLPEESVKKGRYRIGEGITGKVFETGIPEIIPDISKAPDFLGRTMSEGPTKEPQSFICLPIKLENEVIGTLATLRKKIPEHYLEQNRYLLSIVSSLIANAVDIRRVIKREVEAREKLQGQMKMQFRPSNIIGRSKQMQDVFAQIGQVCKSDANVLLLGESGVGKELVAHAIHYESDRARGPFIRVNCAALPESVLESELFGHEKGAFTGAVKTRKGRFEQAQGGTLFLDEIGDFSPSIQVALLRFLQEREIERVGSNQTIKLNVRIIAATNHDLEVAMRAGTFRQDLYYRLNVFPIRIPALRERREDIPLLVDHFIQKYRTESFNVRRISMNALNALMTYNWPGNIRELENFIERAVLLARNQVIRAIDLPPTLATAGTSDTRAPDSLEGAIANLEREMISDALIETRGNLAAAARILDISERIMGLRIKKYGFQPKSYKA